MPYPMEKVRYCLYPAVADSGIGKSKRQKVGTIRGKKHGVRQVLRQLSEEKELKSNIRISRLFEVLIIAIDTLLLL